MTLSTAFIKLDLTLAQAVAAYQANPASGPYAVSDDASHLIYGLAQLQALQAAGVLGSVTMTGAATLSAARAQALFGLPGFALAPGATYALSDNAVNLASLDPAFLAAASSVTLVGGGTVTAAQAQTFAALAHLVITTGAQFTVADSAAQVLANAAGIALARAVVITGANTVTAAQALELWAAPGLRLADGATLVVADSAAAVLAAFAKQASHPFTAITLTGANTVTVAQVRSLFAIGAVGLAGGAKLTVADTATSLIANLGTLEPLAAGGKISAITVLDPTTQVSISYATFASDAAAIALIGSKYPWNVLGATAAQAASLQASKLVAGFTVTDTAAHVKSAIDALNADTQLTGITLTDGATATLSLSYAQFAAAKLRGTYAVSVSGAPASLAASLQANSHVVAFSLSDTAKNVARALDAFGAMTKISGITLTDPGTPTLAITYQQYENDSAALRLIAGTFKLAVSAVPVSALSYLQADPRVSGFAVVDTTADILNGSAALAGSSKLTGITLTDPAKPLFAMTFAQYTNLSNVPGFANGFYVAINGATVAQALSLSAVARVHAVTVIDSAANLLASFDAVGQDYAISSIALTDPGTPALAISGAQYRAAIVALGKITTPHTLVVSDAFAWQGTKLQADSTVSAFTVTDTAFQVAERLDQLNGDTKLTGITLNDGGTPTLTITYQQYTTDAHALALLTGSYALAVSGVSAGSASALQTDSRVSGFALVDSAANVAGAFDALNGDSKLTGIALTDVGTPTLTITYAQYMDDTNALNLLGTNFQLDVTGAPASAILTLKSASNVSAFSIVDSAANVNTYLLTIIQSYELAGGATLTGIFLTDIGTPTLTIPGSDYYNTFGQNLPAGFITGNYNLVLSGITISRLVGYGTISPLFTAITVSDTANAVLGDLDALEANARITQIDLTDTGTPTLAMTYTQYTDDAHVLGLLIGSYAFTISGVPADAATELQSDTRVSGFALVDSAANVAGAFDALNGDTKLTAINLTDSGTPTLTITYAQYINDTNALALIRTYHQLDVTGAPASAIETLQYSDNIAAFSIADSAAHVADRLDLLNADSKLTAINLTDGGTPTLAITYAQYAADPTALGSITGSYTLTVNGVPAADAAAVQADGRVTGFTVSDTAQNILTNLDALNADSQLTTVALTDNGVPTFTISYAQYNNDEVLGKIYQPITLIVTGVPTSAASNLQHDSRITGFTISDSAANVSAAIDTLQRYANLTAITLTDADPQLQLTGDQVVNDLATLKKITNAFTLTASRTDAFEAQEISSLVNASPFAQGTNLYLSVIDSSANILANFQSLANVANDSGTVHLVSISLFNPSSTPIMLSGAQYTSYIAAIKLLQNDNALTVSDASVQMAGALQSDHTVGAFAILDTGANVAAAIDALNGDTKLTRITLSDTDTPALAITYAQYMADTFALGLITDDHTQRRFTLTISGVPAADAATVQADSRVSGFSVSDTAQNILNNFNSLNQDTLLTAVTVTDTGLPVVHITGAQYALDAADTFVAGLIPTSFVLVVSDASASQAASLTADIRVTAFTVTDSAANVSAALDTLANAKQLTGINLTDSGTPAVTLTYAQYLTDAPALALINQNFQLNLTQLTVAVITHGFFAKSTTTLTIADTADNVVQNLDELQANPNIVQIGLTDQGTPTLAITYGQYVGDAGILTDIVTPYYLTVTGAPAADVSALQNDGRVSGFTVSDSAANISATFDAIGAASKLTAIAVTDGARLQLTGDQTAAYFATLGKITGPFALNVSNATVAEEHQLAVFAQAHVNDTITVSVSDTAANISAGFDTLAQDAANSNTLYSVSSLTVTDGDTNRLVITAGQYGTDYGLIEILTNDKVLDLTEVYTTEASGIQADPGVGAFAVKGGASDIAAAIDALNGDSKLTGISFYDSGTPTLAITYQQFTTDTFALGLITGSYTLSIASAPVAQAAALAANTLVSSFSIRDTAANIAAAFDALNGTARLTGISVSDGGTLAITYQQYTTDTTALGLLTGSYSLAVSGVPLASATALQNDSRVGGFAIFGSAANVLGAFDTLNGDSKLTGIALTDGGTPTLAITYAQFTNDTTVLGSLTGSYALTVSGVPFADMAAVQANSHVTGFSVSGAPASQAATLAADSFVTSFSITDSAANVSAMFDILNHFQGLTSITLTDPGLSILTLTLGEYSNDHAALAAIVGPYKVALTGVSVADAVGLAGEPGISSVSINDTTPTVFANLDVLKALGNVAGITFTDPAAPTPPITYGQYQSDAAILNLISTPYTLTVTGVPVADVAAVQADTRVTSFTVSDTTAQVFAALDTLNAQTALSAIMLTDVTAPVQLSYQQFTNDQTALGKIVSPFHVDLSGITVAQALAVEGKTGLAEITINDSAANVAAALDLLENPAIPIGGITLTDGGRPTLALSYSQYSADQSVLASIETPYALTISGVTVANAALLVADDAHVTGLGIVDTAANVAFSISDLTNLPVSTITLTDGPDPTLILSNDQYLQQVNDGGNSALSKITGQYQLVVDVSYGSFITAQTAGMTLDSTAGGSQIHDQAANVSIIAGFNDLIYLNAGNANVIFHSGFGDVSITNFNSANSLNDILQLDQSVFTDWAHVLNDTTQVGNNLVITLDANDTITLSNVSLASFTQNAVKFV